MISTILFVLYKFQEIPEYASLSELAYVLDRKNLLKLWEYFGGQTITIPTIDQLEEIIYAMLLYQYIDVEKIDEADALQLLRVDKVKQQSVKNCYKTLKSILKNYNITPRSSL